MCDNAVRIVSYVNGVPDSYDFEPHSSPSSKVLTAPGQPRAVNITCNSIQLTWNEPKTCGENVERYTVSCFCLDDDDDSDNDSVDGDQKPKCKPFETKNDENTIVIPGLLQNANYQFSVKAQYETGLSKNSKKSAVMKIQPLAGPPGKPSVVNTTSNSVDLTWKKPQENPDNIDGYKVLYRSKDDPPNSEWKSQQAIGVVEQITISGLVPENLYYFKVQAVYNNVEGETSIVSEVNTRCILSNPGDSQHNVDVSPHQATPLSASTSKALPAPGQPKVVTITHNSITLTWKEPKPCDENVEHYTVSCFCLDDDDDDNNDNDDEKPQCKPFETIHNESTIVISGLVQNTNYQFSVKAQYKTGLSKNSKKSAVIKTERLLLVSPGQPKAVNITHNSIELTWSEPEPCGENIECYIVSCFCLANDVENDDNTPKRKPLEIISDEKTIVIPGLVHDTNYKFNVKAQYKTGFSNTSRKSEAIKTQSLVLLAPGQPKAVDITHNSIELTWKKPKPCGLTIERYIVSCFCLDNDENDDDDNNDDDDEPQCQSFETKRDENTILIPGLINDTNYQFSVKAQYKTGHSKNSKMSTVIKTHPQVLVAGPPGKPSIVNTTSNSIDLAWEKPQENPDNMDGYKVLYHSKDDPPNSEWKSQQTNGVVEHITISGLVPENQYYFKVQAVYKNVEGETSIASEANTRCILSNPGDSPHNVDVSPHQATPLSASTSKALPAPGQPKVVNITHNSIKLTWKEPKPSGENVECYIVSCFNLDDNDDDNDDDEDSEDEPKCTLFETKNDEKAIVVPGLFQDTNYQFSVKAQYKTGLSKNSKKSAVIKTQPLAGPPGKPFVVNTTSNSVDLTWEKPQENPDNMDGYKVLYHSKDDPPNSEWKSQQTNGVVERITISGLVPENQYYFKVQAVYKNVEGETSIASEANTRCILSNPGDSPHNVDVSPHQATPLSASTSKALPAPGQPKVVNITHNSIKLTWKEPKPSGENVECYIVSCFNLDDNDDDNDDDEDSEDEPKCTLFETKNDEKAIVVPGLFQDTNYQFSVKAQYKTGLSKNSKKSAVIKTQPLAGPPGKPFVVNTTSNSVDLTWEKPQENPDNMDGYKVLYRSKDDTPNSEWKSQQTNGVVEQITISGLVPENLYYFKVQAVYNNVEGETSIVSEANTRRILSNPGDGQHKVDVSTHQATPLSASTSKALPAPGQPKVVNITHNSIKLTWKEPKPSGENVECYIVSCFNLDDNDDDDDDDEDSEDEPKCTLFETKNDEKAIVVPGLFQDTNYQFSVKAQYKTGLSKNSKKSAVIKTERLLLVSPGQPRAVNITHNSIELTWKEPKPCGENIECYIVSCFCLDNDENDDDDDDDDELQCQSFETKHDENTILIPGLINDTNYQFSVKAQYKTGHSKNSKMSTVINTHPQELVAGPPGKPSVLNTTSNSVDLQWKKPQENPDNMDGYKVLYRSKDDPPNSECKSQQTNGVVEQITISGLVPEKPYYFKVQAMYNQVEGEPSTVSEAYTNSTLSKLGDVESPHQATHISASISKVLPVPHQPRVVNITHNSIELTWKKPKPCGENVEHYVVSCFNSVDNNDDDDSDSDKTKCKLFETKNDENTIVILGLIQDTNYQFSVKAQYKTGLSENSKKSAVIKTQQLLAVAGPPGKPSVVNKTSNSVTLSWEKPQENPHNVDRYKVLYHSKDEPWKTQPTDGAVEQITIDGLFPKKTYYFKVQAIYNQVEGETSTVSDAVPTNDTFTLPSPGKPTAVHISHDSVKLQWSEPLQGFIFFKKPYDELQCYKVLYQSTHDTWESCVIEGTRTNTVIHGLSPATEYIFKVQAGTSDHHFGKESKESDVIMTNHIIPGCPGKPRSMKIGDTYVQLQWTKPVENVEHVEYYVVFYCSLDERTRKWKKYDNSASEEITVTGLTPDTRYSFKVQANSKSVSGKESVTSNVIQTLVPIPSKPGQPEAVSITHNSVNLKWANLHSMFGLL